MTVTYLRIAPRGRLHIAVSTKESNPKTFAMGRYKWQARCGRGWLLTDDEIVKPVAGDRVCKHCEDGEYRPFPRGVMP